MKGTCVHFNGTVGGQRPCCAAGVNYRALVGGPELGWLRRLPCHDHNQSTVVCSLRRLPTAEEVVQEEKELADMVARAEVFFPLMDRLKREHRGRSAAGSLACPACGAALHYRVSGHNGHVWLRCEGKDCVAIVE